MEDRITDFKQEDRVPLEMRQPRSKDIDDIVELATDIASGIMLDRYTRGSIKQQFGDKFGTVLELFINIIMGRMDLYNAALTVLNAPLELPAASMPCLLLLYITLPLLSDSRSYARIFELMRNNRVIVEIRYGDMKPVYTLQAAPDAWFAKLIFVVACLWSEEFGRKALKKNEAQLDNLLKGEAMYLFTIGPYFKNVADFLHIPFFGRVFTEAPRAVLLVQKLSASYARIYSVIAPRIVKEEGPSETPLWGACKKRSELEQLIKCVARPIFYTRDSPVPLISIYSATSEDDNWSLFDLMMASDRHSFLKWVDPFLKGMTVHIGTKCEHVLAKDVMLKGYVLTGAVFSRGPDSRTIDFFHHVRTLAALLRHFGWKGLPVNGNIDVEENPKLDKETSHCIDYITMWSQQMQHTPQTSSDVLLQVTSLYREWLIAAGENKAPSFTVYWARIEGCIHGLLSGLDVYLWHLATVRSRDYPLINKLLRKEAPYDEGDFMYDMFCLNFVRDVYTDDSCDPDDESDLVHEYIALAVEILAAVDAITQQPQFQ